MRSPSGSRNASVEPVFRSVGSETWTILNGAIESIWASGVGLAESTTIESGATLVFVAAIVRGVFVPMVICQCERSIVSFAVLSNSIHSGSGLTGANMISLMTTSRGFAGMYVGVESELARLFFAPGVAEVSPALVGAMEVPQFVGSLEVPDTLRRSSDALLEPPHEGR